MCHGWGEDMTGKSLNGDIGPRISARRVQRGLSQGTVSRRAGMDPSYLCRIETGRISPTVKTALKIADALGCTLNDLVGPFPADHSGGQCPVSTSGHCLMDQVTSIVHEHGDGGRHRRVSPREIRLLRQFAALIEDSDAGMLGALEALLREMHRKRAPAG